MIGVQHSLAAAGRPMADPELLTTGAGCPMADVWQSMAAVWCSMAADVWQSMADVWQSMAADALW